MIKILLFQLGGLFFSTLAQALLVYLAACLHNKNWVFVYSILILSLSSILCFKGFLGGAYLEHFLLFLLASAFFYFKISKSKQRPYPFIVFSELKNLVFILLFAGFFLELLYAALPIYRPDLWNYHLTIPKIVSQQGKLAVPIFNDHIFFSGVYEYFFIFFRIFTQNDTLIQSATTVFSLQSLIIILGGVCYQWMKKARKPYLYTFFALSFAYFALPSHDMVSNGKIEPLLLGFACLILTTIYRLQSERSWFLNFSLGFLLLAPLAGKIIWVHFMLPIGLILLFLPKSFRKGYLLPVVTLGGVIGFLLTIPFFLKNYHFFGNPIHPVQVAFFKSDHFTPHMAWYWQIISGKARSIEEYSRILWNLPLGTFSAVKYLLLGLLVIFAIPSKRAFLLREHNFLRLVICLFLISILIWPFFYRASIFPRFYYPLLSMFLVLFFLFFAEAKKSRLTHLILLLPLFLHSSVEVKLAKILRTSLMDIETFYTSLPSPMPEWAYVDVINQHRRKNFPQAGVHEAVTLSDTPRAYFYDGLFMHWQAMDYDWLIKDYQNKNSEPFCIWKFLRYYKVNYVYSEFGVKPDWGEEFTDVWEFAHPVRAFENIGYLPDELLAAQAAKCK